MNYPLMAGKWQINGGSPSRKEAIMRETGQPSAPAGAAS